MGDRRRTHCLEQVEVLVDKTVCDGAIADRDAMVSERDLTILAAASGDAVLPILVECLALDDHEQESLLDQFDCGFLRCVPAARSSARITRHPRFFLSEAATPHTTEIRTPHTVHTHTPYNTTQCTSHTVHSTQ